VKLTYRIGETVKRGADIEDRGFVGIGCNLYDSSTATYWNSEAEKVKTCISSTIRQVLSHLCPWKSEIVWMWVINLILAEKIHEGMELFISDDFLQLMVNR
jgi:hypothetical protein